MEDKSKTVGEVFEEERPFLIPLPEHPVPCDEQIEVTVGKTPYIRFDLNDYSVPHHLVGRSLIVQASPEKIRIHHKMQEVASHHRCYGRAMLIQDKKHIAALRRYKHAARAHGDVYYLQNLTPSATTLLRELGLNGEPLKSAVREFIQLLELYGPVALEDAMKHAAANKSPHPNSVRHILETERERQQKPPLRPLPLDDPRLKTTAGKPHSLSTYELLISEGDDDDDR